MHSWLRLYHPCATFGWRPRQSTKHWGGDATWPGWTSWQFLFQNQEILCPNVHRGALNLSSTAPVLS